MNGGFTFFLPKPPKPSLVRVKSRDSMYPSKPCLEQGGDEGSDKSWSETGVGGALAVP